MLPARIRRLHLSFLDMLFNVGPVGACCRKTRRIQFHAVVYVG